MAVNCILNVIATCNFYFSDYVSTLLLQTIIVKCDYLQKQVKKLSLLYRENHFHVVFLISIRFMDHVA